MAKGAELPLQPDVGKVSVPARCSERVKKGHGGEALLKHCKSKIHDSKNVHNHWHMKLTGVKQKEIF